MKIALCGKGGSGKSSVTALIARSLSRRGLSVLVIDADESNTGLYRSLGTPAPVNLLDHLGGKKAWKQKLNQTFPPPDEALFSERLTTGELPAECLSRHNGISLLAVGKIHDAGEGCACSLGLLSKTVLSRLDLADDEVVLIDTEAGLEHFGRGVDTDCDLILGIVDPAFESFTMAGRIEAMARSIGLDAWFIINKSDSRSEQVMSRYISEDKILARLPYHDGLFVASLEGTELNMDMPELEPVAQLIETRLSRSAS
ncbi:MAG: P-loop NTPase [Desulfosudaceae bacterium]